ncbi:MAG: class I SAM-dependent methyltransferase [Chloroflexi bacterium]|nr:class I SAM-dependent methyltransferase [Chloroflexota bacterium]
MTTAGPDEILWRHLRDLPYFRAMLRAVEDSFYQGIDLPEPILDLGCGDGHFASVAFQFPIDVGLDPWSEPLKEARRRDIYKLLVRSEGARIPFPEGWFSSAFSNSVLEHIPGVEAVLCDLGRVVRPGGKLVFCVPNHRFTESLWGSGVARKAGWEKGAQAYERWFNRIARHVHLDSPEVWEQRLKQAGFCIEKTWDYFPPEALHVLETGHYFGLPSLVAKKLTGQWVLLKNKPNLWLPYRLTRRFMDQPLSDQGVCSFYIARRV